MYEPYTENKMLLSVNTDTGDVYVVRDSSSTTIYKVRHQIGMRSSLCCPYTAKSSPEEAPATTTHCVGEQR